MNNKYNKCRGNVYFNKEYEFWFVVILQTICIVTIPYAIHNIFSWLREK